MSLVHLGGRPTGPDVRKLMEAFGDTRPGSVVTHHDLARALGVEVESSRYKTVRAAWQKELFRERNQMTVCDAGIGVRFLEENERAGDAAKTGRQAGRKLRRAHVKAAAIRLERLGDEREKQSAINVLRVLEGAAKGARDALKEIGRSFPHQSLPRKAPPE